MEEKILASMIVEILGKPKERVIEALETHVTKLNAEKGVNIVEKTIHDPVPLEEAQNLFTTFAELQVEFDTAGDFFQTLFAYMPANVEIIKPEKLSFSNSDFNEVSNALLQRLHNYDSISKRVLVERDAMIHKLKEISPEVFKKLFREAEPGEGVKDLG
jgi:hypothetical protein